jgi:5'-phosphate synthase pdxT subunit
VIDGEQGQVTFGGLDVTVRRNAFGRQVASFETALDLEGVDGGAVHAVFIRAPWVEEAGPAVSVLGRVASKVVAVRQGRLLATSFHPELTGDARVHALFTRIVEEG